MQRINSIGLLAILFLLAAQRLDAQTSTRYLVKFKNKANNSFSLSAPASFLSPKSIERRNRHNISLDSTDLPVTSRYLDSIRSVPNVTVLNVSKWLNQVSIKTTDSTNAVAAINAFTFVLSATPLAAKTTTQSRSIQKFKETSYQTAPSIIARTAADFYNYGASYNQIHIHNGEFLHNIGLRGQNMIIGMLDAGYQNYLTVKAFDSARANGQILGTYDFVAIESSVNEDNSHGMQCFSTIAANIPGQFVGTAPKANFYLFRTEDNDTEFPVEEHNWVCGAEKIDSAGGDLISSSLGYYNFDAPFNTAMYNHTYADMNGNTTTAAIGADLAAKKGLLVINSAGNEGNTAWRYIITPADGDSVLAVGAVTANGVVASFSSYGPSSDGQVKPDVASVGVATVIQFPNNAIATGNGTSFAAPNLAGLAACLWQGFPEFNAMRIINALRQSGSNFSTPNDRIGYGIPDVKKALAELTEEFSNAAGSNINCKTTITWKSKDAASMKYEIERKAPDETSFTNIGERMGSGSVFGTSYHQYADSLVDKQAGVFQYRIRQVIDTASGTHFYLDTIALNLAASCITPPVATIEKGIILIPNPARESVTIKIATEEAVQNLQLIITDVLGKGVFFKTTNKGTGIITIPVSISNLAKGKYFVSVYTNGKLLATKELLKL